MNIKPELLYSKCVDEVRNKTPVLHNQLLGTPGPLLLLVVQWPGAPRLPCYSIARS
jgi:hypothetical protein